jgi:hypothetical protein
MILTAGELREIKSAVNNGFGLKVSYPKRTVDQTLVVYKVYTLARKNQMTAPGVRYINSRNLKPGQKLTRGPGNYKVNNLLLNLNGTPPSPRPTRKKNFPTSLRTTTVR